MKPKRSFAAIPALGLLAALAGPTLLAAPALATDGAKEVVSVTQLDDALTQEELAKSVTTNDGAGTPVDGNDYTSEDSTLKLDNTVSTLSQRPTKFDLRDASFNGATGSFVTPVKNQNPFATCWSFGANAAAEISYLTENGWTYEDTKDFSPKGLDLSEKQTAWFAHTPLETNYFNQLGEGLRTNPNSGQYFGDGSADNYQAGFTSYATTLFSNKVGPLDESTDPALEYHNTANEYKTTTTGDEIASPWGDWSVPEELRQRASMELEESYYLPNPASWTTNPETGEKTYTFNQPGVDAIKDQLLAGRGVSICFSADQSLPGQVTEGKFINLDTWAHYTYDDTALNHAVCIVGYDDNYPKENFNEGHQPPENGAFIVKNSWGAVNSTEHNQANWGIDGTGYFYLSYYDKSLDYPEAFDFVTDKDDDITFGKDENQFELEGYQYAFLPGNPESKNYDSVVSSANIYEIGKDAVVRDVSIQTHSFNTNARFDIYLLNDGATDPTDGKLLWSHDATYTYGGLHRAEIDQPLVVKQGDRLGVVVTTSLSNGQFEVLQNRYTSRFFRTAMMPDPAQQEWGESVVNEGESFLGSPAKRVEYADGSYDYADYTWTDIAKDINQGEDEFWNSLDETTRKAYDDTLAKLEAYLEVRVAKDDDNDPDVQAARTSYAEAQNAFQQLAGKIYDPNAISGWYAVDNYPITLTTQAYDPENPPVADTVEMFRLYNPNTGEHLYTNDANEKATLTAAGWQDEGTGWTAPSKSNTPGFRLYNSFTGEHLYTTDKVECESLVAAGWTDEGVKFYSDGGRSEPIYRLVNPYSDGVDGHHFTTDKAERASLLRNGWRAEGIAWYGV